MRPKSRAWQFSLAGMLVFTTVISIGLGIARLLPVRTWIIVLAMVLISTVLLAILAPTLALLWLGASTFADAAVNRLRRKK